MLTHKSNKNKEKKLVTHPRYLFSSLPSKQSKSLDNGHDITKNIHISVHTILQKYKSYFSFQCDYFVKQAHESRKGPCSELLNSSMVTPQGKYIGMTLIKCIW